MSTSITVSFWETWSPSDSGEIRGVVSALLSSYFLPLLPFINTWAVLAGGAMFLSIPLFQLLFPQAALGQLIGTIKVGSLARGASSVAVTFRQVNLRHHSVEILVPLLLGAIVGAYFISDVSQLWVLPAMVVAIVVSENARRLSAVFSRRMFQVSAVSVGVYGGAIGAGVMTMILAILRIKLPAEEDIAQVRIDANAVEFLMNVAAVVLLISVGGLTGYAWVAWAIGAVAGGILGGKLLKRMKTIASRFQRRLLVAAYVVALITAIVPWMKEFS
jgi:hypothetical protein